MTQITANIPTECKSSNRCVTLSFNVSNENVIESESSLAALSIDIAQFDGLIQIGTVVGINGVEFTFADTTDTCKNEIGFDNSNVINFVSVVLAVNENFDLCDVLDVTLSLGQLLISSLSCDTNISVTFSNLSNDETFNFGSNSDSLREKDYSVCVDIRKKGESVCVTKGLGIPVLISKTCNVCDIESIESGKDISGYLDNETPLPNCECIIVPRVYPNNTMCCEYEVSFTEQIGNKRFNKVTPTDLITVISANVDDPETYCTGVESPKALALDQSDNKVCLNQCNRAYLILTKSDFHQLVSNIRIKNKQGVVIFTTNSITGFNNATAVEVSTGIPNWKQYLELVGFTDFDSIGSYEIGYTTTDADGVVKRYQPITYNVDCCQNSTEVIFRSSLNTFESLKLNSFSDRTITTIKEVLTQCLPCGFTAQDGNTFTRKTDTYIDYTFYTICDHTSELFLCEFIGSSEVYINNNGSLYYAELITNSVTDLVGNKDQSIPIVLRIYKNNSITQC